MPAYLRSALPTASNAQIDFALHWPLYVKTHSECASRPSVGSFISFLLDAFGFWWCGGMHVMDAFLSILVLGICAFWCQQLVEAGWAYIDGALTMVLLFSHRCIISLQHFWVRATAVLSSELC